MHTGSVNYKCLGVITKIEAYPSLVACKPDTHMDIFSRHMGIFTDQLGCFFFVGVALRQSPGVFGTS